MLDLLRQDGAPLTQEDGGELWLENDGAPPRYSILRADGSLTPRLAGRGRRVVALAAAHGSLTPIVHARGVADSTLAQDGSSDTVDEDEG